MQPHEELQPAPSLLPPKSPRLEGIDVLRGLVIVLMALDHTKDFFMTWTLVGAENPRYSSIDLFFTRWITHFCAPTFVFLAGVSAYLSLRPGQPRWKLAGYLLLRGLLLIALEITVVNFGWNLKWSYHHGMLQVIWAIGCGMVLLSFLVWLPSWCIGFLGLAIIFGHNWFDGLTGAKLVQQWEGWSYVFGEKGWLWDLLFRAFRSFSPAEGYGYFQLYPVLPWFGAMAAGYGLGPVFRWEAKERRALLFFLGAMVTVLFYILRYQNIYGDPRHWQPLPETIRGFMSFVNCTKYPPSLLFLLMTLGPALMVLAIFDFMTDLVFRMKPLIWWSLPALVVKWPLWLFTRFFLVFGRVPLFFYVIHLPTIRGLEKLTMWYLDKKHPSFDLTQTYCMWAGIVLLLFLPCLGYGWLKKRVGGPLKLF